MEGRGGELAVIKGSGGGHPRRMSARVMVVLESKKDVGKGGVAATTSCKKCQKEKKRKVNKSKSKSKSKIKKTNK
jgi:hypothetical protein